MTGRVRPSGKCPQPAIEKRTGGVFDCLKNALPLPVLRSLSFLPTLDLHSTVTTASFTTFPSIMDNIHEYYCPPATGTQFSKTVRFRSVNPGAKSAASASRKALAARQPACISRILEDGKSPNAVAASQRENTALQLQTSTIDHAESSRKSGIQRHSLCTLLITRRRLVYDCRWP